MRHLTFFLTLFCLLNNPLTAEDSTDTRTLTDRYIQLTFDQEYDALEELYAPDVVFEDPTADVFQGPVAEGPVRGADRVIAMQKGWGLGAAEFEQDASFTVGRYSLYRGTLKLEYPETRERPRRRFNVPFVTILKAEQGKITERLDFGEYLKSFRMGDDFDAVTETTRRVADAYRDAYLNGDLATQAELMAEDVIFQDPTASVIGESEGSQVQGASTLVERRRPMYEAVESFELAIDGTFYANHHALYMGSVSYRLKTGAKFVQPAVLALEVRDGKIQRHWDFVDYSVPPVEPNRSLDP